jgi:hypothetical protein
VIGVLAVGSLAAAAVSTFVAPFALTHGIGAVRGFFVTYTLTALAVRIGGTRWSTARDTRGPRFAGAAGYGLVTIALAPRGPEHLILLGAAFGVVHGIVFPALMALVLGESAREERPRLLAFANGAINLGIAALGVIGADRRSRRLPVGVPGDGRDHDCDGGVVAGAPSSSRFRFIDLATSSDTFRTWTRSPAFRS